MSVIEMFEDVFSGNLSHAWKRIEDWWNAMPDWLKDFVKKVETDAGKLLTALALEFATNVINDGLTTDSFVTNAKAIESKLKDQGIAFARTEVFAALNLAVGKLQGT